jgi:hypothetical protein
MRNGFVGTGGFYVSFSAKEIMGDEYVLLQHEGTLTIEELYAGRVEARDLLEKNRWKRLLIDLSQASIGVRLIELFTFTVSHSETFPRYLVIAVVGNQENSQDTDFAEAVACNRGLRMKVFHDCDQARAWLMVS